MYRYTRCSLEYIEGVVRLSGSSAGVERMCLRTRRVRELRGRIETHHRGASVPTALLVWRIMVREQPEATTRRRPRPRPGPRLNCQSTTCTLGTREQGEMLGIPCLGAPPRPAPAPSASRLLLLGASRLRSRRHVGRAPLSPLERGPRPTGRPRALPLVRGRHRQSIYGREQILTG